MTRVRGAWCLALGALLMAKPAALVAQVPPAPPRPPNPLQQAFDLEQRGKYAEAVTAYRAILGTDAANETALLGLERSLAPLERLPEMAKDLQGALAGHPSPVVYGVALRVWAAANQPDSMRKVAAQWATTEQDRTIPFRQLGDLFVQRRDFGNARKAYLAGRAAGNDPDALAAELAQVSVFQGDFTTGASEWLRALRLSPGYRSAAIGTLVQAPEKERPGVLRALSADSAGAGALLRALLLAQWGDPAAGAELLKGLVADPDGSSADQTEQLTAFITSVRTLATRPAQLALARALELLGARQSGAAAARSRLEAARAFADGGAPDSAHRMLALIAGDQRASPELAAQAARTLIEVEIADGALDSAEATFTSRGTLYGVEDRSALRRRLADAWIRQGALDRASRLGAGDSTVDGEALAGRIALFRGDLKQARALFQDAGPYAGTREEATARTALLALIQPVERDSFPELGAALLAGERGDTTAAIAGLDRVAAMLAPDKGGAALALRAAELVVARGAAPEGERRLKGVAATGIAATAPAAELDLARLLLSLGRRPEAIAQLEHLILTWPQSAFVPQARRLLDEARQAVPTA